MVRTKDLVLGSNPIRGLCGFNFQLFLLFLVHLIASFVEKVCTRDDSCFFLFCDLFGQRNELLQFYLRRKYAHAMGVKKNT